MEIKEKPPAPVRFGLFHSDLISCCPLSCLQFFRFLRVEPWDKVVPSSVGARNIMANQKIKYISIPRQ